MDNVLLALRETEQERDLRIRSLFNSLDTKNNGFLDEAALSRSHYKYAKDLLNVCDSNQDGRIDYPEFKRYMDHKELELYLIFQSIDVEQNASISPQELLDALLTAGTLLLITFTRDVRNI